MKMTKIESARIVVKQKGVCYKYNHNHFKTISCDDCFNGWMRNKCANLTNEETLALAEAYIKRHEQKTKKKDHILDTYHKKLKKDYVELKPVKVTRPNFRKYLRDKIDMKVRVTPELSEELQKICFEEGSKWFSGRSRIINTDCEWLSIKTYKENYVITAEMILGIKEYNPETDTLVEKVEEPKPIKTVGIDNSDVTLAQHEPTPLQIAKMIRDDRYRCLKVANCKGCPLRLVRNCGNGTEFAINEERKLRRQLIDDYISANEPTPLEIAKMIRDNGYVINCKDFSPNGACGSCTTDFCDHILSKEKARASIKKIDDYISANEPVKDCPVNSEIPQPIKLPDFVYSASKNGVGFIDTKNRTFNTNDKGELLINDKPCFATPEEAVIVAKKLWNGDGK